ncbi:MAG TPA: dual specificity protein phosphatase [Anaerolineales bacterium]
MVLDFSQITENLFIGTTPQPEDYPGLNDLGIRLVINMRVERRPKADHRNLPIKFMWLPTFDSPLIPIPIRALERGAKEALETIKAGDKVYVHCAAGAHRGVAMGSAVLIAQGYSPEEAMQLIKTHRAVADPDIWYIRRRIIRFAQAWDHRQEGDDLIVA